MVIFQDYETFQCIHVAVRYGHSEVVSNLITKHGVDPRCRDKVRIWLQYHVIS